MWTNFFLAVLVINNSILVEKKNLIGFGHTKVTVTSYSAL